MSIEILNHTTVYAQDGVYASHPANHGAWQSENGELLVGFLTGRYSSASAWYHPVVEPYTKMQARSSNGGETWDVETPTVDFDCLLHCSEDYLPTPGAIFRVSGVYDTGGDHCHAQGGFYVSNDFGRSWQGAYRFRGLEGVFSEGWENSSRTCVDFPWFYLSRRRAGSFGSDECFRAKMRPDGVFEFVDWVSQEEKAVMPALAWPHVALRMRLGPRRIELRTRQAGEWVSDGIVAKTGNHNGNPPALIWVGSHLVCAYANRSKKRVYVAIRTEDGWEEVAVRSGRNADIGYPRLFALSGNDGCVIYYWSDDKQGCTAIECTKFRVG